MLFQETNFDTISVFHTNFLAVLFLTIKKLKKENNQQKRLYNSCKVTVTPPPPQIKIKLGQRVVLQESRSHL